MLAINLIAAYLIINWLYIKITNEIDKKFTTKAKAK